jgi:hypothetical protein
MKREHIIRIVAGTFVLSGLALGRWVSEWWLLLPAFVGINLIQSALTKWCLLDDILKKLDMGEECR